MKDLIIPVSLKTMDARILSWSAKAVYAQIHQIVEDSEGDDTGFGSTTEMAKELGLERRTVQKVIVKLKEMRLITTYKSNQNAKYTQFTILRRK